MNKLSTAKRAAVVAALVEGNSIRATARITSVSKPTVLRLLVELGNACLAYHDQYVRNLRTKHVQCDEIWSFVGAKQKNVSSEKKAVWGDLWTWTALDADSKLMISWLVGKRDVADAYMFLNDVSDRLSGRVQLTSDGYTVYLRAVEDTFGEDIDFATLTKIFAGGQDGKYSPPRFVSAQRAVIKGNPDAGHISTSYVERQNLTMRMSMRRFTRLTNGFSKKATNHAAAVALHFMHYNFCRPHMSLRVTPAMQAGIASHVWSIEELVGLLDAAEKKAA
jgi:IS1 family transposase